MFDIKTGNRMTVHMEEESESVAARPRTYPSHNLCQRLDMSDHRPDIGQYIYIYIYIWHTFKLSDIYPIASGIFFFICDAQGIS